MSQKNNRFLNAGFALLLALAACSPAPATPAFVARSTPTPSLSGNEYTVVPLDLHDELRLRGRVVAKKEASLSFPAAGTVQAVHVAAGDEVSAGQLLMTLDVPQLEAAALDTRYQAELAQLALDRANAAATQDRQVAYAEVAAAQAAYDMAAANGKQTVARAQADLAQVEGQGWQLTQAQFLVTLAQAGVDDALKVAAAEVAAARATRNETVALLSHDLAILEQQAARAQALAEQAAGQVRNTQLTAPFDGVLISMQAHPGDHAGAFQPVAVLADTSALQIKALVFESDAGQLSYGLKVKVVLDTAPDTEYEGQVIQIADQPTIWQGQNAYEVLVAFDAPQAAPITLRGGATLVIPLKPRQGVLAVPRAAIRQEGGMPTVWVRSENGGHQVIQVALGVSAGDFVEVAQGLTQGQIVLLP